MKKHLIQEVLILAVAVILVGSWVLRGEAGSKTFDADKGQKFDQENIVSVGESAAQLQQQEDTFRQELLARDKEVISLLKEIQESLKKIDQNTRSTAAKTP